LIDPKVVELNHYNGIPHLLIPVVTDPSKAATALNWAVSEMTSRYKRFAEVGVKDLETYNKKMLQLNTPKLHQIVIVIDELADLMMAAPAQVEESICRLAQMARAAGMHLIVATQRPSVDVITGVIKANIPSRISFAVSSQFDSRTILDMAGAERLVGKGDMLFNPLGLSKPIRVQGAFISDAEVKRVIDFLIEQVPNNEYSKEIISSIDRIKTEVKEEENDELLQDAIASVVAAEQASVSMLQRRFRIGYNRAARLIDFMEESGIIGPADGSRARKVLITKEELIELREIEELAKQQEIEMQ
jgi:S-DNA-T family DNA segregation ATPase FtsK/SpoIIIE